MSRPADRLTGRDAGQRQPFATRPFGTSAGEAAAAAAAAAAVPRNLVDVQEPFDPDTGDRADKPPAVTATTGAAGGQSNLTTGGVRP